MKKTDINIVNVVICQFKYFVKTQYKLYRESVSFSACQFERSRELQNRSRLRSN